MSSTAGKVGSVSIALPLPTAVKATLTGDVDGDGTPELLAKELEGLSGGSVAVTTTDGKVTAFSVTSTPPPPASPTTPPPVLALVARADAVGGVGFSHHQAHDADEPTN